MLPDAAQVVVEGAADQFRTGVDGNQILRGTLTVN